MQTKARTDLGESGEGGLECVLRAKPRREMAVIGDALKSIGSIGDMKRVTRLADGAKETDFVKRGDASVSLCAEL